MISYKDWLKLYYIATKFSYATLFLLILFIKNAYAISEPTKYFFVFLTLLYLAINLFYYVFGESIILNTRLRYLDYLSLIPLFVFSKNLYGILPATVIFGGYGTLYWKETVALFVFSVVLLIVNISVLNNFSPEDFFIVIFYLISVILISSKLNLIGIFRNFKGKLNKYKVEIFKLQSEIAQLNRQLRIYNDTFEVLEQFYNRQRDKQIDKILKNLLGAEKVLILSPKRVDRIPPQEVEGCIRLSERDFVIFVKPKEKYLEKDRRYRQKLELMVKILKPYIETFLANSR